jgi:3-dehydroquinate dehydratase-2
MRTAPLVEVHISNIAAREGFRHESVITGSATGIIAGFGFQGYVLALRAIAAELARGDGHQAPPGGPGAR